MELILFIVLIVLLLGSFGGGMYQPTYRPHGIGLGTVLLIVLLLWLFGVFGHRPFHGDERGDYRGDHDMHSFPERR